MRPPPGGTCADSVRSSGPQKERISSARRGRIGGIGPSGASGGAAAAGGAPASPVAITALRQRGDKAAALACRQRKAAEPPGFTPGQCTPKSERQAARMAATCGDEGFLPSAAAGAGGGGVAGSAMAAGGSSAPEGRGGAAAAGGGGVAAVCVGAGFACAGAALSVGGGPAASSAALHDGDT